ncbi:uncharacterized protein METZ01_LOCUS322591, partial [marine metagenome]
MNPSEINLEDQESNLQYQLLTIPKHAVVQINNIGDGYTQGDINVDGIVNVNDIVAVVNMILAGEYNLFADLNVDEIVNVNDIVAIINIILD